MIHIFSVKNNVGLPSGALVYGLMTFGKELQLLQNEIHVKEHDFDSGADMEFENPVEGHGDGDGDDDDDSPTRDRSSRSDAGAMT